MPYDTIYGFETDTVWGIGAHPKCESAINKIYEIKGRDKNKPLILMSDDFKYLEKYVKNVSDEAYCAIEKHLPGGLTLILEKSDFCPCYISKNTIAIRIPNHKGFFKLLDDVKGRVLATTSLNLSNEAPCKNYEEAILKFSKTVKIIKPKCAIEIQNVPSTVADFTVSPCKILRQGSVIL